MSSNNLTRQEAQQRASLLSNAAYKAHLDLTNGDKTFECTCTVTFEAKPGSSTFIDYTAPEVSSIRLNGQPLSSENFDGNRIHLSALESKNELTVRGKSAYMNTGVGLHRFVDPIDDGVYLHTQFEPFDAHRVYPCFDQPDIKATFDFTVQAPADWKVISNTATLPGPVEGGARTWKFPRTKPMSTYITAFVAGPFEVIRENHRGIDLGLWCRKSLLEYLLPDAGEIFTVTGEGFDFFEKLFGYPYVFGKYDQLFVPEFNSGAMENAGAVTFTEGCVFRSRVTDARREWRASIVLHEMAHMWFGDLVTMRWWDDLWLNESFATYQGTRSLAEATRFHDAWTRFAQGSKSWAYSQDQLPTTHPITADIPDIDATHSNFDGITYSKGASVLKQLVAWVGQEAFDEGVRSYFKRHEYANTELSDFLGPLEEASGRDLHSWAKEWLQTAGVNTFHANFETSQPAGEEPPKFEAFSLVQEAPEKWPTLRSHRITIGLYEDKDGKLSRHHQVELDAVGEITEVTDMAGRTVPPLIIVNDADLAYAKVRLDEHSLQTVIARVGDIDDSLPRAICWSATWEMVRDAGMAARDYLRMVLGNIDKEDDIGMVQTLLGQARTATNQYGDPANRRHALETLAAASRRALAGSEPNSDPQRAWAESFIAAATSSEHLEELKGMLDGRVAFEGLAVDVGLRWQIVGALAAAESNAEALIRAEENRDPTDEGKRHALMCLISRPLEQAKEEGWRMFTEDASIPLASLRAISGGFYRHDQVELAGPFVDQYFESLGRMWQEREPEVARTFAAGMFPRVVVDPNVAARVDDYIENNKPPYALTRILLEAQDSMNRSIKARKKDASAG